MVDRPKRTRPSRNELLEVRGRSNLLFVTVTAQRRAGVFATDTVHHALLDAWSQAGYWLVGRYVIMPDHVHFFCAPGQYPPSSLRHWVKYWKRLVSQSGALPQGEGIWQRDCWDTQMRTGAHYTEKWAYVRENPVRAGLVARAEDWPYAGEVEALDWCGQ
ncbi:MAG: putative transposase [Lentimonas sp.]|jgi:putative transposase